MNGISTRLHWTGQQCRWHVNVGKEVSAVLDGQVAMRYRQDSREYRTPINAADVFFADARREHGAHPQGEARILLAEQERSS